MIYESLGLNGMEYVKVVYCSTVGALLPPAPLLSLVKFFCIFSALSERIIFSKFSSEAHHNHTQQPPLRYAVSVTVYVYWVPRRLVPWMQGILPRDH